MKEMFERGGNVVSLEDLVGSYAQKPNSELLNGIARARDIIDEFSLNSILKIKSTDAILLHAFIADRIIKTKIYDFDWIMHSPEFVFSPKEVARNDKNRAILQESLDRLSAKREEVIINSYIGQNARLRARKLELAANDLVARATIFDEKTFTNLIIVSDELVDAWTTKWQKEFKPKAGYAKQKRLFYKKSN